MLTFRGLYRGASQIYMSILLVEGILLAFATQILAIILMLPFYALSERTRLIILGSAMRLSVMLCNVILNPFWRVHIIRACPKGYVPRRTIIMVNHSSSADPWVVTRALFPIEAKYIYKKDLEKIPLVGCVLRMAGDVALRFTKEKGGWGVKREDVQAVMKKCAHLQDLEIPLVIFPEGTRSSTGGLQPFKNGFFQFALDHQCDILPCIIHNSKTLWPKHSKLMTPGEAYFAFGDPIVPTAKHTVESLKAETRQQMLSLMEMCPSYDPEIEKPLLEIAKQRGQGIIS